MRSSASRLFSVLFALALVLTSPGAVGQPAKEAAAQAQTKVTIALGADARTLLPMAVVDWTTSVQLSNMFDALFIRDRQTLQWQGQLATELRNVNDTTWELQLRRDVKFHNGEPLNADSILATLKYIQNPDNKSHYLERFKVFTNVERLDDYSLRITTSEPFPLMYDRLAEMFPFPAKYVEERGYDYAARNPVGTGAYVFKEWVRDERLVMTANRDYWNGAPALQEVTFRYIPEFSSRLAAMLSGEVDIVKDVPPDAFGRVEQSGKARVESIPSSRVNFVQLVNNSPNLPNTPLNDKRVRQAFNYAVDVDALVESIHRGRATRMPGVLSLINPDVNRDIKPYPFDPDRAIRLLREAGVNPRDVTLTLDSPNGRYPLDKEVSEAIAAQLNAVLGITVRVRVNEWGAHLDRIVNRNSGEMVFLGWGPALNSQFTIEPLFQDKAVYSTFKDDVIEAKIREAVKLVDPAKRKAAFDEIQADLWEAAPWIFLWQQHDSYAVANWLDWSPRADEVILMHEARIK